MKLYTEEQLKRAYFKGASDCHDKCINRNWRGVELAVDVKKLEELSDEYIKSQTSTKLPNDEEIDQYINSFPYTKHLDDGQYNDGVMVGAELAIEWYREQLKKKTK